MRKLFIVVVVLALAGCFFFVGCAAAGGVAKSVGTGVVAGLTDSPIPAPPLPAPLPSEDEGGLLTWGLNFLAVLAGYTVGSLGKGAVRKYLPGDEG